MRRSWPQGLRWVRAWPVAVLVLMTLPLPFLLPTLPAVARPVADHLVLLLALALALGLPFRARPPQPVGIPATDHRGWEACNPVRR